MVLVLLVMIGSVLARHLSSARAEANFPPPGRLIEFDGRLSHIYCAGSGSPTIVLESDLDTQGSRSWAGIFDELAQISRTCAYDRAGILWSEPREEPRDAERIVGELHALLEAASEPSPYVLVGHSLGGLFALTYDQQYPDEIAGFVFVDSSHPDQDDRLPAEVRALAENQADPPRWLMKIFTPYRVFIDADRNPETAYWFRSFPEGVLGEAAAVAAASEQARRTRSLGDRPVIVLTASETWRTMSGVSKEGIAATRRVWLDLQEELARLSTNSDHTKPSTGGVGLIRRGTAA